MTTTQERAIMITTSTTAKIHGWGCNRWKWVSGLTPTERAAVRNGGIVLVNYTPRHYTQSGTKSVLYKRGRYIHREYYN